MLIDHKPNLLPYNYVCAYNLSLLQVSCDTPLLLNWPFHVNPVIILISIVAFHTMVRMLIVSVGVYIILFVNE